MSSAIRAFLWRPSLQPHSIDLAALGQLWFKFTTGQILNVLLILSAIILMAVFSARARTTMDVPEAHPTGRKLRKMVK
jgi:hypothetical protein